MYIPIQNTYKKKLKKLCRTRGREVYKLLKGRRGISEVDLMYKEKSVEKKLRDTSNEIDSLIRNSVERTMDETLNYYSKLHERITGEVVSESKKAGIKEDTKIKFLNQTYYGKSYRDRIELIIRKIKRNISLTIELFKIKSRKEMAEAVSKIFYETPVEGGSLKGQFETLMVGEQVRIYHYVSKIFFEEVGIHYVKVKAPDAREGSKIYKIANHVDSEIKRKTEGLNISPIGIYSLNQLPDPPHPRVRYHLEPVYEIGFIKL